MPDDLLDWAGGVRCDDCRLPYPRSHRTSHFQRDPSDGVRRCPSRITPLTLSIAFTGTDNRFLDALTPEQVYIASSATHTDVPYALRGEYAAALGATGGCLRLGGCAR